MFEQIVESVMNSMKDISYNISLEIRDRLPQHEFLESMCVVFPHYWSLRKPSDFRDKLLVLIDQFCKRKEINEVTINGVLDEFHLRDQPTHFSRTMMEQYDLMRNPREEGLVTKLFTKLAESEVLRESISKIFKLAKLCLTMILRSMEDERVFSALGFLK